MNSFWNWNTPDETDVLDLLQQGLGPKFLQHGERHAGNPSEATLGVKMPWSSNVGTPVSPPRPTTPMTSVTPPPPPARAPIPEFAPPPAQPIMPMGASEMHEMQHERDSKRAGVDRDPRLDEMRRLWGAKMMADAAAKMSPKDTPPMQINHPQPGVAQPGRPITMQTIDPITLALAGFRGY